MLANFYMWGIKLLLRAVLNILVRNASPRWPCVWVCVIQKVGRDPKLGPEVII